MDDGIKRYQQSKNLRVDGRLNPAGETEREMVGDLTGINPSAIFGQASAQQTDYAGFGGTINGTIPKETKPKNTPTPLQNLQALLQRIDTDDQDQTAKKASLTMSRQEKRIPKPGRKPMDEKPNPSYEEQTEKPAKTKTEAILKHDPYAIPKDKEYYFGEEGKKARDQWIKVAKDNADMDETFKGIVTEIVTFEGGPDTFDNTTRGGITVAAFKDLHDQPYYQDMVKKYGKDVLPKDLSHKDMQGFYSAYFDRYLQGAAKGYSKRNPDSPKKGSQLFDLLGDKKVATATADSLFRHGSGDGVKLVQQAMNKTLNQQDKVDAVFGSGTFGKLKDISGDKELSKQFLKNLRIERDLYIESHGDHDGDRSRNRHFAYEGHQ